MEFVDKKFNPSYRENLNLEFNSATTCSLDIHFTGIYSIHAKEENIVPHIRGILGTLVPGNINSFGTQPAGKKPRKPV